MFRTRQWSVTWIGPVFERVYRAGGFVLFTLPVLLVIAAVCAAGVGVFAYLIGEGDVAPFVVASKVGLGGIVFLLGRFLVVVVHEFAHGLTVASFGRKVPKAGLKLMLVFPVCVRGHIRGVVRAGAAADRDQRCRARSATSRSAARRRSRPLASSPGTMQDVWFQLSLAAYTGAIFNLNPLLDRDGYHILVDLMREPGLRRRSREWLASRLSGRPAEPDDAGVLATYARHRPRLVARDGRLHRDHVAALLRLPDRPGARERRLDGAERCSTC